MKLLGTKDAYSDLASGSTELSHLLLFSWDVGDEHVLIERNGLQITKKPLCPEGHYGGPSVWKSWWLWGLEWLRILSLVKGGVESQL